MLALVNAAAAALGAEGERLKMYFRSRLVAMRVQCIRLLSQRRCLCGTVAWMDGMDSKCVGVSMTMYMRENSYGRLHVEAS